MFDLPLALISKPYLEIDLDHKCLIVKFLRYFQC